MAKAQDKTFVKDGRTVTTHSPDEMVRLRFDGYKEQTPKASAKTAETKTDSK